MPSDLEARGPGELAYVDTSRWTAPTSVSGGSRYAHSLAQRGCSHVGIFEVNRHIDHSYVEDFA